MTHDEHVLRAWARAQRVDGLAPPQRLQHPVRGPPKVDEQISQYSHRVVATRQRGRFPSSKNRAELWPG
jgi:hypothetical protein